MNEHEPSQENPYAAPQSPLQWVEGRRTPCARLYYFATAFRITVVIWIIGILWMGIRLLMAGQEHGQWKMFFTLGIFAIYVFMSCLVVMMVLCSLVVGLDLLLQYLGLCTPPAPRPVAGGLQRVEPDATFFKELANQQVEASSNNDPR